VRLIGRPSLSTNHNTACITAAGEPHVGLAAFPSLSLQSLHHRHEFGLHLGCPELLFDFLHFEPRGRKGALVQLSSLARQ